MKEIWVYSKSVGDMSVYYAECSNNRFLAGKIKGTEMDAIITALFAFMATLGPENINIFFHKDQTDIWNEFNVYEKDQNLFINILNRKSYAASFKKYHAVIHSFSFLVRYHLINPSSNKSEMIKNYVQKICERENK
jgi:hypothetical protein